MSLTFTKPKTKSKLKVGQKGKAKTPQTTSGNVSFTSSLPLQLSAAAANGSGQSGQPGLHVVTRKLVSNDLSRGFRASTSASASAPVMIELDMFDDIGESWWSAGITAKGVKSKLDAYPDATVASVRLNSPGGDAIEGVAIYNVLRNWAANKSTSGQPRSVSVSVYGIAASAASVIAMAGDTVTMGTGSMLMVHNAWNMCVGYASDMRKNADVLDTIGASLASIYAESSGMPPEECRALMDAETWMTADQAVTSGFATSVGIFDPLDPDGDDDDELEEELEEMEEELQQKALATAREFQLLRAFRHVPAALLPPSAVAFSVSNSASAGTRGVSHPTSANLPSSNSTSTPTNSLNSSPASAVTGAGTTQNEVSLSTLYASVRNGARHAESVLPKITAGPLAGVEPILAVRTFGTAALRKEQPKPTSGSSARALAGAPPSVVTCASGVVAPYNTPSFDLGGFVEVYQPGCFQSWLSTSADYRVLFNHDPSHILGRRSSSTARMWDTDTGLSYSVVLPDTSTGRDVAVLLERKDVTQASAAFFILQHRWETRDGVKTRVVERAAVLEGSIVSFAYYKSSTAEIESAQDGGDPGAEDQQGGREGGGREGADVSAAASSNSLSEDEYEQDLSDRIRLLSLV